ncbi:MAG: DedA protein, partial [uncultured Actinomycetospora sp.]
AGPRPRVAGPAVHHPGAGPVGPRGRLPDHLRGVRAAGRLLPPGRLAALHHRARRGHRPHRHAAVGGVRTAGDRRVRGQRRRLLHRAQGRPGDLRQAELEAVQARERRPDAGVLRQVRQPRDRARPVRADRAHVHHGHGRCRAHGREAVLHVLRDRRRAVGRRRDAAGRRARPVRRRQEQHRGHAHPGRGAVGDPHRHRGHQGPAREEARCAGPGRGRPRRRHRRRAHPPDPAPAM